VSIIGCNFYNFLWEVGSNLRLKFSSDYLRKPDVTAALYIDNMQVVCLTSSLSTGLRCSRSAEPKEINWNTR
jgi:hypothetical protein